MDSASRPASLFNKIIFWCAFAIVAFHILIGAQYVFFKQAILPGKLHSFYSELVVLGPFFREDRIKVSPHLYVRHSTASGKWSAPHDYGMENLRIYQHNSLRYDKLKWSSYERYLTRKAYITIKNRKYIDGSEGKESRELVDYLRSTTSPVKQFDSLQLIYVWNTWMPEEGFVRMDTAAVVVYKFDSNDTLK